MEASELQNPYKSKFQKHYAVRSFLTANKNLYKENKIQDRNFLYIFKLSHPNIIVRIDDPIKKQHSWCLKTINIQQYISFEAFINYDIIFKGELIISMLSHFNKYLNLQIQQQINPLSKRLKLWVETQIKEIYWVQQRAEYSFGFQNGYIHIQSLHTNNFKMYLQTQVWRKQTQQDIKRIVQGENIKHNCHYGNLLILIDQQTIYSYLQSQLLDKVHITLQ